MLSRAKAWLGCFVVVCGYVTSHAAAAQTFDELTLRSIGPAVMGGRIDAIAVVATDPSTIYLGTASGGVWKTANKGTTWKPVFDDQTTSSIGDVAVAPSDSRIVWVGTGEPNNRQSSSFGDGVYKSMNGGATWSHVGLEDSGHVGRVIIDPSNPERVFVAALGSLWRAGGERGVFRTLDGGRSWTQVLAIDDDTGVSTLALDPVNANVLYAAAYQRRRTPWGFDGGGGGSGLYKTIDGGDTWTPLTDGLPAGPLGRIGIAVFPGDPDRVFALVQHESEGGLYRSSDQGESWRKVNELNPRPMYYSKIFLDPIDPNRIYVLGSSFHVSTDGGETFVTNRSMTPRYDVGVHGDHHALWIDPHNPKHLVLGGDGGLYFSWDRSESFTKINNLPIAQFYAIGVDMDEPYNVYAGAQDTHSWMGPSATRNQIGILNGDWAQTNFGDGMYQQADPTDSSIIYTESQGGNIVRLDRRTGNRKAIKPHPEPGEGRYRFHWTAPIRISGHDPKALLFGGNRLFMSSDRGESWIASPDLTRNEDRDELSIMGAIPNDATLSRHDGVAVWGTITTISESPHAQGTIYVGTDDGRIQLTRDSGASWTSVETNLPDLDPARSTVSRLVSSAVEPARAYASLDRHALGDFAPYLFVTEDYGASWRRLELPEATQWINVVAEHPDNGEVLFVGSETGLFVSFDRGASWSRMRGGFPTVPVDDLVIHPRERDLVVGTHGRSIFILDDVAPLARYRPGVDAVQLFAPRRATAFLPWKHESYGAQAQYVGENPPAGALITYHLPEDETSDVTVSIAGGDGSVVRQVSGSGHAGFNRVVWDLRAAGPDEVEGARGPLVPPGRYTLGLEVGSERRETTVDVVVDPRANVDADEFRDRYEFLNQVNALLERMTNAGGRADALKRQARGLVELLDDDDDDDVRVLLDELQAALDSAKDSLVGPRSFRDPSLSARASRLFGELAGSGVQQGTLHGPTSMQRKRLAELTTESTQAFAELDAIIDDRVPSINELLRARGPLSLDNE